MTDIEMRYDIQAKFMNEALMELFGRGMRRCSSLPRNGYRRRLHYEGLAILGQQVAMVAQAAALLIQAAGKDLEGG